MYTILMCQLAVMWHRRENAYLIAGVVVFILCVRCFAGDRAGAQDAGHNNTDSSFASLVTRKKLYSEPELFLLLRDQDSIRRQFAVLRLAETDTLSPAGAAAVVGALSDKSANVRYQALAGLMRLDKRATEPLARSLWDYRSIATFVYDSEAENSFRSIDISISDMAFAALSYMDSVDVDTLLGWYHSGPIGTSADTRKMTQSRIQKLLNGIGGEFTPGLYKALQDDDPELRRTVVRVIGQAGPRAKDAVPILVQIVENDKVASVRVAAADAMARISPFGHDALRSLLSHPDPQVRAYALDAYPDEQVAFNESYRRLTIDSDTHVRRSALLRIAGAGQSDELCKNDSIRAAVGHLFGDLPATALSTLLAQLNDTAVSVRLAAISAASTYACARPEQARSVVEALALKLIDPAKPVAYAAAERMAQLAALGYVPTSRSAADLILNMFTRSLEDRQQDRLLVILSNIDWPEDRREAVVHILFNVCVDRHEWGCEDVYEKLGLRRGWSSIVWNELLKRYHDFNFDPDVWPMISTLGSRDPEHLQMLRRLLTNRKLFIRASAAMQLASNGDTSNAVISALGEAALRFEGYAGWAGEAADSLAHMGDQGIERIARIVENTSVKREVRSALMYYTLARVAKVSTRATNLILSAAKGTMGPEFQESAVWALRSIDSRPDDVGIALESAMNSADPEVRYAVVYSWAETGLPAGRLIVRAFADEDESVRRAAVSELLPLMSRDDPQALSIARAAVYDQDESVRDEAVENSGKLGAGGRAILTELVRSNVQLTHHFFSGLRALDSLDNELVRALQARAIESSEDIRTSINMVFRDMDRVGAIDLDGLYAQLDLRDVKSRTTAATFLLSVNEDPWQKEGLLASVLMEAQVQKVVCERLGNVMDRLFPPGFMLTSGGGWKPPSFPWPPPPGYTSTIVPRDLFRLTGTVKFGQIYDALVKSIESESSGFEHGLFLGVPDGFVIVARMERVDRDGIPFPEPARWMKESSAKLDLMELLGDVFFEEPGYFRIIVFALTRDLSPGVTPRANLPDARVGAVSIPNDLAARYLSDQQVLALVYSFERQGEGKIELWKDGAPSAREHLIRSGLWNRIAGTGR